VQAAQPEDGQCHEPRAESELLQETDVVVLAGAMNKDGMGKVAGPEDEQEEEEGVFPATEREGEVLAAEGGFEDEQVEINLLRGGGGGVEGICGRGRCALLLLYRRGGVEGGRAGGRAEDGGGGEA